MLEQISEDTAQRCDSISLDTGRELHQICYGLVIGIIYVLFPNDLTQPKIQGTGENVINVVNMKSNSNPCAIDMNEETKSKRRPCYKAKQNISYRIQHKGSKI